MKQQPFLPLFFGDFLAATAEWSGEEQSLYLLLMGHQWALGSIPMEDEKVRRLSRWERGSFARAWATVRTKFNARDGRLFNERLEEHREHAQEISKKRGVSGSKGAAARYGKPEAIAIALATSLPCHPNQTKPEEENPSLRSGAKESSRESLAHHLPNDFELTPELAEMATAEHLDPQRTFANFCDYWRAASGQKARKRDWQAAFRVWCRSQIDRNGGSNGARGKNPQPRLSAVERVYAATDAWLEQQGGGRVESHD